MKQRPILFSAAMVRALLDGSKTQTRRIVKAHGWTIEQMSKYEFVDVLNAADASGLTCEQPATTAYAGFKLSPDASSPAYFKSPFGTVGDQLWVREAFNPWRFPGTGNVQIEYAADGAKSVRAVPLGKPYSLSEDDEILTGDQNPPRFIRCKGRPSIHMPRWASRIQLEITGIRVERLQDISSEDAKKEGIAPLFLQDGEPGCWYSADTNNNELHARTAKQAFQKLWESINGAESFNQNPWVWVIELKRVTQ